MPRRDKVYAVVAEWAEKAEHDLKTASHTLALGEKCPTDTVCFHAQQCAEKYIKALLVVATKAKAEALKAGAQPQPVLVLEPPLVPEPAFFPEPSPGPLPAPVVQTETIRLVGAVPPEVWNRLGTKILPKLRSGADLKVGVDFSVTVSSDVARSLASDLRQILDDPGLAERVRIAET